VRHAPRLLATVVGLALIVGACGGSATPAPPDPGPTLPAPTDVPGSTTRTPAPSPGTFATAWGAAWDALPPGFPVPAGATQADPGDPADGPVSGAFVVDGAPDDAARAVEERLTAAGYSTEALSGPYEDGSLVIDSVGRNPGCWVQTRIRELGGVTMMTVLFGASCPWS
jgi:hypothetical protein